MFLLMIFFPSFFLILIQQLDNFFDFIAIAEVYKTWNQWLGPLVIKLPETNLVIEDIKEKLKIIFS